MLGAAAGLVGSLMAIEVVKALAGTGDGLSGCFLHIDAMRPSIDRLRLDRPAACRRGCTRQAGW